MQKDLGGENVVGKATSWPHSCLKTCPYQMARLCVLAVGTVLTSVLRFVQCMDHSPYSQEIGVIVAAALASA